MSTAALIILGIDPGTVRVGYAVLETHNEPRVAECGLINVKSKDKIERLAEISKTIKNIISRWGIDILSIEELFFFKNAKTAISVAEARGAIILTAIEAGLKVYEYTPLEVKQGVTGFGRADKKQVAKMVQLLTGLETSRLSDDTTDAIAIALAAYSTKGRY